MPRRIIIDTDPGIDDAVAILLALAAPEELEVLGIVAVAGNLPLALTERTTRASFTNWRAGLRSRFISATAHIAGVGRRQRHRRGLPPGSTPVGRTGQRGFVQSGVNDVPPRAAPASCLAGPR